MDIAKTIKNLELRGYTVKHFATRAEAAAYMAEEIHDTEVGFGGSVTAEDRHGRHGSHPDRRGYGLLVGISDRFYLKKHNKKLR